MGMNIKRIASRKTTDGRSQTRDDKLIKGTAAEHLLMRNEKSKKLVYAAARTVQSVFRLYAETILPKKPHIYLNELSNYQTVRNNEQRAFICQKLTGKISLK